MTATTLLNGLPNRSGATAPSPWLVTLGWQWQHGKIECYAMIANLTGSRFIAAEQPPHLKAIAPWEGLGDFYREHICRGGIPDSMFVDILTKTFSGKNQREDVVAMVHKYPLMNKYWEDKNPNLQNIVVPMYVLGSYSTPLHIEGSIRGWKYSNSKDKWSEQPFMQVCS